MSGEGLGTGLLGMAAFCLAIYGLKFLDKNSDNGIPGQKDKPLPNDNVIQAINDMWEDRPCMSSKKVDSLVVEGFVV